MTMPDLERQLEADTAVGIAEDPVPSPEPTVQQPGTELAEAVARFVEADPHDWSTRPCQTCRAISAIVGRNFGCSARRVAHGAISR